ncbi:metallophosphoesterase family protein [Staphylococcus coagulans]|uniref:metallophosphoesterase family protein n=1 Tax=Staphylococcus coagulans TaxID=74706 RepID=UPI0033650850
MSFFRILQFTDLHLSSNHDEKDQKTFKLLEQMISTYHPDLCVFTGDQIWTQGVMDAANTYKSLLIFLNQFDTQIATTFGNHDIENQLRRSDLRNMEAAISKRYVDKHHSKLIDDKEAYVVEIFHENELSHLLYIIDGGDYSESAVGEYAYIHPGHIAWMSEVEKYYQDKSKLMLHHNLVFTHIPIPEYQAIASTQNYRGIFNEEIGCPTVNSGLFAQMLSLGHIEGMFCGHDHDNDFSFNHYGIGLNYGRTSGFNCYGDVNRGARLIDLSPYQPYRTKIVEYDQRF